MKKIYCLFLFIQSTRCDCFRHKHIKSIPVRYFQLSSSKASTTPARKKRIKSCRDGHNKKNIHTMLFVFQDVLSQLFLFNEIFPKASQIITDTQRTTLSNLHVIQPTVVHKISRSQAFCAVILSKCPPSAILFSFLERVPIMY